jgi:peptidoglycan/LPS O-acetylase OafA/YrhL
MAERRHDLDWLRIFAVLLLIYFHSARIFDYDRFYVKNAVPSFGLAAFIVFLNQWHMQLFFLVAGSATFYALGFRSGRAYAKERFFRLFVPFVFGLAVIIPPQGYFNLLRNPRYHQSYLQFLANFIQVDPATAGNYRGTFEWGHLWFILYLFTFSLLALPLFLYLRGDSGRRWISRLAGLAARPAGVFLFFIPIALSECLLRPHWSGMQNLLDDWANFCSYLTYFIFGYLFCSDERFGQALDRSWKWALIPAFALFAGLFWLYGTDHDPPRAYSPGFMLLLVVAALHSWSWLVVFLGLARRYLNFSNRVLNYANPAAYPFYLLHQTVIVIIGFYVVQWNAGVPLKYLVITTAALVGSILIYDVLVKRTNITRMLFGMKPLAD